MGFPNLIYTHIVVFHPIVVTLEGLGMSRSKRLQRNSAESRAERGFWRNLRAFHEILFWERERPCENWASWVTFALWLTFNGKNWKGFSFPGNPAQSTLIYIFHCPTTYFRFSFLFSKKEQSIGSVVLYDTYYYYYTLILKNVDQNYDDKESTLEMREWHTKKMEAQRANKSRHFEDNWWIRIHEQPNGRPQSHSSIPKPPIINHR